MKEKGFFRRALALLCSGALLAVMAVFPPAARAAGSSPSLQLTVEGTSSPIYDGSVSFTPGETLDKIIESALDADHIAYSFPIDPTYGPYVRQVDGQPASSDVYWNLYVNDAAAGSGIGGVKPADGDSVVLALADYPILTLDSAPQPGAGFSATLHSVGFDASWQIAYAPAAGAAVTFDGKAYTADSNGTVSLPATPAGTYPLTVGAMPAMAGRSFSVTVSDTAPTRRTVGVADTDRTVDLSTGVTDVDVTGGAQAFVQTAAGGRVPAGFHATVRDAESAPVCLDFPAAATVSGTGWNGVLSLPHRTTVSPFGSISPKYAVQVGSPSVALTLSEPARLTLPGQTGRQAGYIDEGGKFHSIPQLSTDSLGSGTDGFYDNGSNLVVYTRHLSTFIAYTPAADVSSAALSADSDGAAGWLTANAPAADWSIFALARAGKPVTADYAGMVKSEMDENGGAFSSAADLEKAVLILRAAGVDPTDFDGVNLVDRLANDSGLDSGIISSDIYGLLALDSADYTLPAGARWNSQAFVQAILSAQNADGSFAWAAGLSGDPDITAMALTALAPHKGDDAAAAAIGRALAYLQSIQQADGGFIPGGDTAESSESAAQVVIALSSLGRDPQTDAQFLKYGTDGAAHSVLDSLLGFRTADGGFAHQGSSANVIATQQALMALTAYRSLKTSGPALYDLSGVAVKKAAFGGSADANTTSGNTAGGGERTNGSGTVPAAVDNPKTGDRQTAAPAIVTAAALGVLLLARRERRRKA